MEISPIDKPDAATVSCPRCRVVLSEDPRPGNEERTCHICGADLRFLVFPRLIRQPKKEAAAALSQQGDASCVFYPELKAQYVCEECGSFLSEKASVNWGGRQYCMPCLHHLREKKSDTDFQAKTVIHENRALALTLFLLPLSLFTAPVAIFILLKHRKASASFIPRTRLRWWLALLVAAAITGLWVSIFIVWASLIAREFS